MRKRYLLVIIVLILIVSIFSIIYYLSLPTTFPNVFNEPQNQGNDSQGDKGFLGLPFRFPWQTTQTTPNQSSGGGSEGGGGAGAGGTGGGAGTGGTGEETSTYIQNPYYKLSVDSVPDNLKIFASYYVNGIESSLVSNTPFSLETDPGSPVCMLLASMIGNNTLKWTVDEQDCQFSVCEGFSRTETLYSDYGCLINMNEDHSVTLNFIPS
jgi:hypothetical protein